MTNALAGNGVSGTHKAVRVCVLQSDPVGSTDAHAALDPLKVPEIYDEGKALEGGVGVGQILGPLGTR